MLFVVAATLWFGAMLVLVVVPSLYITDLNTEPYQPANTAHVNDDQTSTSHGIRQRLFLLFMIPAAAVFNACFVYAAYYRHVRNIFYRMELGEMANAQLVSAGKPVMQLLRSAVSEFAVGAHDHQPLPQRTPSCALWEENGSLSRDTSGGMPSTPGHLFSTASFVLAAVPSVVPAALGGGGGEWLEHRRRVDVSREACPAPLMSDIRALLDKIDAIIAEGETLRAQVAAEVLQRCDAARDVLERRRQRISEQNRAVASPGSPSPSNTYQAIRGALEPQSLDTLKGELDELRTIASSIAAVNVGSDGGSTTAVTIGTDEALGIRSPTSNLPTDRHPSHSGSVPRSGSSSGNQQLPPLSGASEPHRAPPTTQASPPKQRIRRANSRIVFTRHKARGRSSERAHSPATAGYRGGGAGRNAPDF